MAGVWREIITEICGSIIESNEEDIFKTLNRALDLNVNYIELRLDVIEDITSKKATGIIERINDITDIPLILTNRTKEEGGFFCSGEENRIKILADNAPLVEYTDIELNTDEILRQHVIDNANRTIVSYHNFEKTPSHDYLSNIVSEAKGIGDIAKIAVKPLKLEDTYILLRLLMEYDDLIGISMDKLGAYTRIIGPLLGSPITYAAINDKSAPGQFDVETTGDILKKLKYRSD